jgi:cytosine/adenosine deaminase-related metal-dependent hydrolase
MKAAFLAMARSGTFGCADFREGGVAGVELLRQAARDIPFTPVVFGREGGEAVADGLGISSVRDVEGAEAQVEAARRKGKRIALHAGEKDAEDVEEAISLEPDLLVHATHATDSQLRSCADAGIPLAVCPRSNWTLGVTASSTHPPLRRMIELGCTLLLGTDNVMFVQPDLFQEMAFVATVYGLPSSCILKTAIQGASYLSTPGYLVQGGAARFFCVDASGGVLPYSHDPCTSFIKRVNGADIVENVLSAGYE